VHFRQWLTIALEASFLFATAAPCQTSDGAPPSDRYERRNPASVSRAREGPDFSQSRTCEIEAERLAESTNIGLYQDYSPEDDCFYQVLQMRVKKLEAQARSATLKANQVENRNNASPRDPIPFWGILSIGLSILAVVIACAGLVWLRADAESSIRKALHEAGLL
jgi:hypothetical protein